MIKNGKDIECSWCKKVFYISKSRIGKKKFCSNECAFKHQKTQSKTKRCVICKVDFLAVGLSRHQQTTCSSDCHYQLQREITKKSIERRKKQKVKLQCKGCQEFFIGHGLYKLNYCSTSCQYQDYSKKREGTGNPNYRGGLWSKDGYYKNAKWGYSKAAQKHTAATTKYAKKFVDKHGYKFCEVCKINQSLQFSVHHIYYASRYPKHPELHNTKNLILVCLDCHTKFHAEKYKEIFKKLEIDRDLKKLFF